MSGHTEVAMSKRFDRKVVLVTGASSGIGRAAALLFANEGAYVIAVARRVDEGERTVQRIWDSGGTGIFIKADISKAADCRAMVEEAEWAFGGLDIAFNNAGIGCDGKFIADESEESWQSVLDINLKGVFLSMKYEIPALLRRGGGAIVNNSSVGGSVAIPGMAAYQASKHGVLGLTQVAALEYATRGIRVNAICPGAARPEEVARAALRLASGDASFMTGHALAVDGGQSPLLAASSGERSFGRASASANQRMR
jgi:NAD(P)-dependent dehydrogenase (short-subunit alcohol dehydrogenase family)